MVVGLMNWLEANHPPTHTRILKALRGHLDHQEAEFSENPL
jgi:hypothetical protein